VREHVFEIVGDENTANVQFDVGGRFGVAGEHVWRGHLWREIM
jgi:hypothetical protein